MSAKKTSTKATKAKAAVKAKAPRAPRATKAFIEKRAKTVVKRSPFADVKPKADVVKQIPAKTNAKAKASVKKAVKTTLAMQTANAPFIKGVDPDYIPADKPAVFNRKEKALADRKVIGEARIVKAVGKGKRVVPQRDPETGAQVMVTSPPAPAEAFPTQQMDVPKYTMARSYMRKGAPGEGQLRRGTYQCTVSFTPEQMAQVREAAVFRAVSLAELIRSFVVAHLNANAGPA